MMMGSLEEAIEGALTNPGVGEEVVNDLNIKVEVDVEIQEANMDEPGPSTSSLCFPYKKRPNNKPLTANEKTIALNIYKFIEESLVTYPYKTDVINTTAEIMGISDKTIARILKEYKTTGKVSNPLKRDGNKNWGIIDKLDDFTLAAIRVKIEQLCCDGIFPTVNQVHTVVNEDKALPSFSRSTIHKVMKKLNFHCPKRSKKS